MANDFIDPPPEEVPDDKRPKVAYPDVLNGHEEVYLPIRKARILPIAENLHKLGYDLVATHGTAAYIGGRGIPVRPVLKVSEGRPNVVDDIKNGTISLIINTPLGHRARQDEYAIGWTAIKYRVPFITTLSAAEAMAYG